MVSGKDLRKRRERTDCEASGRGSFVAPESEWREGKKKKMLDEWRQVTERAKEAGLGAEELKAELDRVFGEGLK